MRKYQSEYEPILRETETSGECCHRHWKWIAQLTAVIVIVVLLMVAIGLYFGRYAPPPPPPAGRFRILFFSDFYRIEGVPLFPTDQDNQLGGVSRLATLVKQQRAVCDSFSHNRLILRSCRASWSLVGTCSSRVECPPSLGSPTRWLKQ